MPQGSKECRKREWRRRRAVGRAASVDLLDPCRRILRPRLTEFVCLPPRESGAAAVDSAFAAGRVYRNAAACFRADPAARFAIDGEPVVEARRGDGGVDPRAWDWRLDRRRPAGAGGLPAASRRAVGGWADSRSGAAAHPGGGGHFLGRSGCAGFDGGGRGEPAC